VIQTGGSYHRLPGEPDYRDHLNKAGKAVPTMRGLSYGDMRDSFCGSWKLFSVLRRHGKCPRNFGEQLTHPMATHQAYCHRTLLDFLSKSILRLKYNYTTLRKTLLSNSVFLNT
jgi:hypothetical protein